MKLIVKTFQGLEETLASELKSIGAQRVTQMTRGVECVGDETLLYRANLELRTALRVLVPIHSFKARNEDELYKGTREVDWTEWMDLKQTLAVDAVTQSNQLTHSRFISLRTKDAIVDQFRERFHKRPDVDPYQPHIRVHVHISQLSDCTVLLDSSGDPLFKRGYRTEAVQAPLNEVLAAGMIKLSGWDGTNAFADGMCGSGTLLIEAALIAGNIVPQFMRDYFCFKNWKNFRPHLWDKVRKEAFSRQKNIEAPIVGSDILPKAIEIARENIFSAGLSNTIRIDQAPFDDFEPPASNGTLMMNPPYDERLKTEDIQGLYKMIGDRMKKAWSGWDAWIISSHADALKSIGLRPSRKIPLFNGPLECRFARFELYAGSKKNTLSLPE